MHVVDMGDYGWTLLQDGDDLILDVLCSHSAVDYQFTLKLNPAEISAYRTDGAPYLDRLAYEIHYSAPGVLGNSSIYSSRKMTRQLSQLGGVAVDTYLKSQPGQHRGNSAEGGNSALTP